MGWSILVGLVVILVVIGVVAYFVTIYNSLVRLRNDIDKAWSNIDVLLKQRHDELPKLIETCRGYMEYEQQTLRLVTEARSAYQKASTVPEKAQADNVLTGALKTLFAVAENYPDLKANGNFIQLQNRITDLEDKIAAHRELFNDDVNRVSGPVWVRVRVALAVAGLMHLERKDLFKVAEEDRRDVEVKFA